MSRWKEEFEAGAKQENQTSVPRADSANSANRSDKAPETGPIGAIGTIGSRHEHVNPFPWLNQKYIPKDEEPNLSAGPGPPVWDAETLRLIAWFKMATPPTGPLKLCRAVTILDAARWWRDIESDIGCGPNGPRARYGAVQGDLKKLHARMSAGRANAR